MAVETRPTGRFVFHLGIVPPVIRHDVMTVMQRTQAESYFPTPFDVSLDSTRGRTLVNVVGELDVASAPMFGRCLDLAASRQEGDVIINFAKVTFVDGHGLAQVVRVFRVIQYSGRQLFIVSPSPMARKLLTIIGLEGLVSDETKMGPSRIPLPVRALVEGLRSKKKASTTVPWAP